MSGQIIEFYRGTAPDHRGRFLAEIQQWPDERLESVHDFIQWLFPLLEPSPVNPLAPVLDEAAIDAFHASPELHGNLKASFARMAQFYGFKILPGPPVALERAATFAGQAANWLHPYNHNHLRITRILKCLSLLGLGAEARAFFDCLAELYGEEQHHPRPRISRETFRYWQSAIEVT